MYALKFLRAAKNLARAYACVKTLKKALTKTVDGAIMIVRRIAYLYKIRRECLYGQAIAEKDD